MIEIYGIVDRPLRRRRLPHRHRAAREPGILAGVRPGDARAGAGARAFPTSTSSAKSPNDDWPARQARRAHAPSTSLPSVLDFAFSSGALTDASPARRHRESGATVLRAGHALRRRRGAALQLPTFLGNHDARPLRDVTSARRSRMQADEEVLKRVMLGHVMMLTAARRADHLLRATSRASPATAATRMRARTCSRRKVAVYNDNELLGIDRDDGAVEFRHRPSALPADRELARHPRRHSRRCARGATGRARRSREARPARRLALRSGERPRSAGRCSTPRPSRSSRTSRSKSAQQRFTALAGQLPDRGRGAGQRAHHASAARLCGVRCSLTSAKADAAARRPSTPWWRGAAIYQIYPRSFADSQRRRDRRFARHHRSSSTMSRSLGVDGDLAVALLHLADARLRLRRRRLLRRRSGVRDARRFRRAGRTRACARPQGHHRPGLFAQLRPASLVPGKPVDPRQSQGRLVRLGRRQAGRLAAQQLAVGVRRPGVDLGRAARPILSAQFPAASSPISTCTIARCRTRCSTSRNSGSTAASTASASTRSTSRCTTRSCAIIRRRRPAASARGRSTSSSISTTSRIPTSSKFLERLRAADRQLRRPLHAGRSRRRSRAERNAARSPRAMRG